MVAIGPTQLLKRPSENGNVGDSSRIVFSELSAEHANTPHPLLRLRRERTDRSTAERDDAFLSPDMDCHATLPRGKTLGSTENGTPISVQPEKC